MLHYCLRHESLVAVGSTESTPVCAMDQLGTLLWDESTCSSLDIATPYWPHDNRDNSTTWTTLAYGIVTSEVVVVDMGSTT